MVWTAFSLVRDRFQIRSFYFKKHCCATWGTQSLVPHDSADITSRLLPRTMLFPRPMYAISFGIRPAAAKSTVKLLQSQFEQGSGAEARLEALAKIRETRYGRRVINTRPKDGPCLKTYKAHPLGQCPFHCLGMTSCVSKWFLQD